MCKYCGDELKQIDLIYFECLNPECIKNLNDEYWMYWEI